jgi:hypothetical protein
MTSQTNISKGEFDELIVNYLSFVKSPANRRAFKRKSDGQFSIDIRILKKDAAKRRIYGVVYEPNVTDTQGDWANEEVIERAAHRFLRMGLVRMVDEEHSMVPGSGTVIESFILRGEMENFEGIAKGAWCVVIEPAEGVDIDKYEGLSLAGYGTYKSASAPQISFKRAQLLRRAPSMRITNQSQL